MESAQFVVDFFVFLQKRLRNGFVFGDIRKNDQHFGFHFEVLNHFALLVFVETDGRGAGTQNQGHFRKRGIAGRNGPTDQERRDQVRDAENTAKNWESVGDLTRKNVFNQRARGDLPSFAKIVRIHDESHADAPQEIRHRRARENVACVLDEFLVVPEP